MFGISKREIAEKIKVKAAKDLAEKGMTEIDGVCTVTDNDGMPKVHWDPNFIRYYNQLKRGN